jgi:hypothetical protein
MYFKEGDQVQLTGEKSYVLYFTGLLAEIRAVGLTEEQIQGICESADTTPERINECLALAEYQVEKIKGNTAADLTFDEWLKLEDVGYVDPETGYHLK